MLSIRHATPADAALVAAVARRTFFDAYHGSGSDHNLTVHLNRHYGERQQAAELADHSMATLLIEEDGVSIGFAQLATRAPPPCVTAASPIEIKRFYIDQVWKGRGAAQTLMSATIAEAVRRNGDALWLVAWNRNFRAIAFYRKSGFEDVGTMPYLFGEIIETDVVMARPIGP